MKIGTIGKIAEVFSGKNWELDEEIETSKFNLFCKMMGRLENEAETDLMIELLEDFLHIDSDKYTNLIGEILTHLLSIHEQLRTLFVLPLIAEADIGKNKSTYVVLYKFRGTSIKHKVPLLERTSLSVLDKTEYLPALRDNQLVVLVDDFIGTGETAISALDYLLKLHPRIDKSKICFLSIVIHRNGYQALIDKGFKVFYSIMINKGISDKYDDYYEIERKLSVMQSIEDRLHKLQPEYRFGYLQTEGLVCMERTPNNTFPIFWYDYKSKYKPPFPR